MVFDPLTPFLGAGVQDDRSVRRALGPLSAICERTGAAAILVRHLSKAASPNVLYQGAGSIALIAAARSALLVARDPADAKQQVIAPLKSNLAPLAGSLAFRTSRPDWWQKSSVEAKHTGHILPDCRGATQVPRGYGTREFLFSAEVGP